jgi:hypothetical protein
MWWYRYLGVEDQTPAEKRAMSNGVNLFFGALIGANLGTLDGMTLSDYTLIIAVVCLIVMYIQLAPVARKRWTYLGILGGLTGLLYVLLIDPHGEALFRGRTRPPPHLFVTISFWLASVDSIELRPLAKPLPDVGDGSPR